MQMRSSSYHAHFDFWFFWATFGEKMDVDTPNATNGLEPKNPTKNLAHWVKVLSQLLSRIYVFINFQGVNPHPWPHPH